MSAIDNPSDAVFHDAPEEEAPKPSRSLRRRLFGRRARRPAPTHRPVRRRHLTPLGVVFSVLKYGSLLMMTLAIFLPLLGTFMVAFKTHKEYFNSQPMDPPGNWLNFNNFVTAFNVGHMLDGFINTTFILVVSVTGTIIIGTMTAYAIDRFQFRGRSTVLFLFLLAAIVPSVTQNVGTFQVINFLGLFNTRFSAMALFVGTDIISIYIFVQFMRTIPIALDEFARIEGASHWYIYRHIAFPLMRPAIVTVIIIKGVAIYNEFYIPFLYMPSPDLRTVSTSLFQFNGTYGAQWEVVAAGVIITLVPTLILFLALQRYIYNGLIRGSSR
jgi:multiple sugar transport system permease protein